MSGFLAVAFGPSSMAQASAELPRVAQDAQLIELRLDAFHDQPYDLAALLAARGSTPVVVTLRPTDQGGASPLAAPDRLPVLLQAAQLGAEYVDLEWDAATPSALAAFHAAGAQVIVSRHDFDGMPADLAAGWWSDLARLGADIVKVVGTARDVRDCLPVLRTLRRAERPTVAMAMGLPGLPSRILALREPSCFLTYAAPDTLPGTAPGQVTLSEMRQVYHADRLGPSTAVYGLLGPHSEPERAAEYNAWFSSAGRDAVAVSFPTSGHAAEILREYRDLPVGGWHIHGEALQRDVVSALDDLDTKARAQNKVNAVVARDHTLCGTWVESPREQFAFWTS
jgi:3-dehydroquinate dehydratase / shikimate dehydrogenase